MKKDHEAFELDPMAIASARDVAQDALDWAAKRLSEKPILIYSTATPEQVKSVQEKLGRELAGSLVEETMGKIAKGLVRPWRTPVAGRRRRDLRSGGRCTGVEGLAIGPEFDPGVPWTFSIGQPSLALALKSGNFGTPDFFTKAFKLQP
jgi:uncharacterized protein YgbK (DUF1537 family)